MTRTFSFRLIASGAVLALSAAPGYSVIFDQDDRQYVSPVEGSPYASVGMVTVGSLISPIWYRSTGFLVDDCHVLTSHVVVGYGPAPIGKRAKFEAGIGTPQYAVSKGTVVAGGQQERFRTGQEQFERGGGAWILLRLDQCLGTRFGHVVLKTGPFSPYEFRDLKSAGYPVHRSTDRGLTVDPSCSVYSGTDNLWNNDCALVARDAGGPIFRIGSSGGRPQMEVYAMQAYGFVPREPILLNPSIENRAIPMSFIAPQIARFLSPHTLTPLEASAR